jgi:serine/threonine protein kinase
MALEEIENLLKDDLQITEEAWKVRTQTHLGPNDVELLLRTFATKWPRDVSTAPPETASSPDEETTKRLALLQKHVRACADCQSLLAAAYPRSEFVDKLAARLADAGGAPVAHLGQEEGQARMLQLALALRHLDVLDALDDPALEDHPWKTGPFAKGTVVKDRYVVGSLLGRGGVGVVYRGEDRKSSGCVAVKVPQTKESDERSNYLRKFSLRGLERLMQERSRMADASLPRIAIPHFIGKHDSEVAIVRDLLEGPSLADQLAGLPQDPGESAGQVEALARTLHAVHAKEFVHGGLKPSNVFLAAGGELHVTDLGVTNLWCGDSGELRVDWLASPDDERRFFLAYVAPEQLDSPDKVGPATDIYGLGAILYEMLTGAPPFVSHTSDKTLQAIRKESPRQTDPALKVPRALEAICMRCLEKNPEQRFPTALALADALSGFLRSWADGSGETISGKSIFGYLLRLVGLGRHSPRTTAEVEPKAAEQCAETKSPQRIQRASPAAGKPA